MRRGILSLFLLSLISISILGSGCSRSSDSVGPGMLMKTEVYRQTDDGQPQRPRSGDSLPCDTCPNDTVYPRDTIPEDTLPPDTDTIYCDTCPIDTIPGDTIWPDTLPWDTVPTDTIWPDTLPWDTLPWDTLPGWDTIWPGGDSMPSEPPRTQVRSRQSH